MRIESISTEYARVRFTEFGVHHDGENFTIVGLSNEKVILIPNELFRSNCPLRSFANTHDKHTRAHSIFHWCQLECQLNERFWNKSSSEMFKSDHIIFVSLFCRDNNELKCHKYSSISWPITTHRQTYSRKSFQQLLDTFIFIFITSIRWHLRLIKNEIHKNACDCSDR